MMRHKKKQTPSIVVCCQKNYNENDDGVDNNDVNEQTQITRPMGLKIEIICPTLKLIIVYQLITPSIVNFGKKIKTCWISFFCVFKTALTQKIFLNQQQHERKKMNARVVLYIHIQVGGHSIGVSATYVYASLYSVDREAMPPWRSCRCYPDGSISPYCDGLLPCG